MNKWTEEEEKFLMMYVEASDEETSEEMYEYVHHMMYNEGNHPDFTIRSLRAIKDKIRSISNKRRNTNKISSSIGELAKYKILLPVKMIWDPKEDITAHELALCLPYFFREVMPTEIDNSLSYYRHFKIINPNI